jgi:DNA polymerase-1
VIEFWILAPHPVQCFYPESISDWMDFDQWITERQNAVLGLDTESNARNPWDDDFACRLVQISDGQQAWNLDPLNENAGALPFLLCTHPKFVAMFPGIAEIPFLANGVPGSVRIGELEPHIVDYQVVQAILFPRTLLPAKEGIDPRMRWLKGLKVSYQREVSPCLANAEAELHAWFKAHAPVGSRTPQKAQDWGWANVPITEPVYQVYGAMDAVAVKVLYDQAVEKLATNPVLREEADIELVLQWDDDNMVYRGNPVDPPYVHWLAGELDGVIAAETPKLAAYGIPPSGMGAKVGTALAALGVKPVKQTQKGAASWDKDALSQLTDKLKAKPQDSTGEILDLLRSVSAVRRAGKFRVTYVQPMLDSLTRDCRIHCNFRSIGTVTHRNSASNPPLQQQPKKDTRVRAAFGGIPGWVWVTCDLEQGEPRFMAGLSGDPKYVAAVQSGDVNNVAATAAFGARFNPAEGKVEGTDSYLLRQNTKAGFLAVCYAVGLKKLASMLGLTVARVAEMRDNWKSEYSVMFARAAQMNQLEFVTLPSGRQIILWDRKIVMPDGRIITGAEPSRKALNYETQGAQADYLKACWWRLRARWAWALAFLLHDEIALYLPSEFAEQAAADLKEAMTRPVGHGVIMEADAKVVGPTWLPQPKTFDRTELESVDA